MTFSQDAAGRVTRLTVDYRGKASSYEKTSDQPPEIAEPPKPRIAIKLDTKRLDAYIGHYEFATEAAHPTGTKLVLWREGDQLVGQTWDKNGTQGAFDVYPETEVKFFDKIIGVQLTFIKNDKGEVT